MSFQFTAKGTPAEVTAKVEEILFGTPECPPTFGDAIIGQLALLPEDSTADLAVSGKCGWGAAQTKGQLSLHMTIDVTAANSPGS